MAAGTLSETITINGRNITIPTGLFINNEFVKAQAGKTFVVENPSTAKPLLSIQEGLAEDVDIAVKVARRAFDAGWADSDPAWRASLMLKLADLLEKHQEEIGTLEAADAGKTYTQTAHVDIPASIGTLRYFAGWADKIYGRTGATVPGAFSFTQREPVGVCGQIIPWKYGALLSSFFAPATVANANTLMSHIQLPTPDVHLEDRPGIGYR